MSVVHLSTRYGAATKKAQAEPNYTVLVVDDDPNFRNLAEAILAGRGYKVWHAKSGDEALSYLDSAEPALVIVDYRLPGMDGIEWIKLAREKGTHVPMVLCTGAWIDPTTFKWIRNMLRVSLVIQKPIVPQLFLQSIESILPPPNNAQERLMARAGEGSVYSAIAPSLKTDSKPEEILQVLDEAIRKESDSQRMAELVEMRKRTATQHCLAEARREFLAALPDLWAEFVAHALKACADGSGIALKDARDGAHRLRGTVGSYGFANLSALCGKLETLLVSVDPTSVTMNQLVLTEIERCVGEGDNLVRAAIRTEIVHASPNAVRPEQPFTLLAVVPEGSDVAQTLVGIGLQHSALQIEFAYTAIGAHVKAKSSKYDAVVIDTSVGVSELDLAKDLRAIPGYLRLPFGFIADADEDKGRLHYAGATTCVSRDADMAGMLTAVLSLRQAAESAKARVLCIDDDSELTHFVEALLSDEGYQVRSLNEPIDALEAAQEFKPDLILVDAVMPGISGFDVCRALKTHECTAATPVLFLTASADASSRSCAFQAGAEDFVTKPIVLDELITRTKKYLPSVVDRLGSGGSALVDRAMFMTSVNHYIADREIGGTVFLIAIEGVGRMETEHGAMAVDHVSTILARLVSLRFRPTDLRTQLDRDKFAVFVPDMGEADAEKMRAAIEEEVCSLSFASGNGGNFVPKIAVHAAQVGQHNELHG